jgi:hypothetical protein
MFPSEVIVDEPTDDPATLLERVTSPPASKVVSVTTLEPKVSAPVIVKYYM